MQFSGTPRPPQPSSHRLIQINVGRVSTTYSFFHMGNNVYGDIKSMTAAAPRNVHVVPID
jgi:hypothetical protein